MFRNITLCVLSALLLILAFPQTDLWFLAWTGLVPLMFALGGKTPRAAFKLGYVTGIVFFSGTLVWFINMSASAGIPYFLALTAVAAVVLYLSLYFGAFSAGYAFFASRNILWKIFLLPSLWVILEFARDWLFTGFGWVNLGHSQYKILPLIQIADITGVFGISFLIVMVNVFLKELILPLRKTHAAAKTFLAGVIVFLIVSGVVFYGRQILSQGEKQPNEGVLISIVQPNVPQSRKWLPAQWPAMLEELAELTTQAAENNPDLIIWPETSFPGYFWEAEHTVKEIQAMAKKLGIPILFGAITKHPQGQESYFNSAILLSHQGLVTARYDKMHLVPFGEYIPLREYFPFLGDLIPILDFTPGDEFVLFPAKAASRGVFAVLICFEDTIPRLTRRAVRAGAGLLVNITNDAWFLDTKEPFLHLQSAVFRSIENRRSLVRAANTGISCFIDSYGRIKQYVQDSKGKKTFVRQTAAGRVAFSDALTFYTKHGDVFVLLCSICFLTGFLGTKNS